jgi:hypothetical protein
LGVFAVPSDFWARICTHIINEQEPSDKQNEANKWNFLSLTNENECKVSYISGQQIATLSAVGYTGFFKRQYNYCSSLGESNTLKTTHYPNYKLHDSSWQMQMTNWRQSSSVDNPIYSTKR